MKAVIISAKGSVVIPGEIRKRYGLNKGDEVHFIDYDGVIAVVPVSKDPIRHTAGMLKGKDSMVEALLESRRQGRAKGN